MQYSVNFLIFTLTHTRTHIETVFSPLDVNLGYKYNQASMHQWELKQYLDIEIKL